MALDISSTAFDPGTPIPTRCTCEGDDISPALHWRGVPAHARSLVLIVDDPDAPDPRTPKMTWVHWVLANLPVDSGGLPEGVAPVALPAGTVEGLNDWKRTGYGGPCPPIGRHRYFHKLYALDVVLDESKREKMSRAGLRDVEAFVALQKGGEWYEKAHGDADQLGALRQANRYFERVIERVPDYPLAYELHSDLYIHLLLNDATGQPLDEPGAEELATAGERIAANLQAAADFARTPQERNATDLDRAYLTSDWRGMPARIGRAAEERGCGGAIWLPNIAVSFGFAAQLNDHFTELRNCDPLRSTTWVNEARSLLWSGDPDGALAIARQGMEVAPGDWLAMQLVNALLARGEFETAEHEISIAFQDRFNMLTWRMMAAAAKGDREAAAARFAEYLADPGSGPFTTVAYHAWTGDIEQANRLAAKMDAHPFAGPSLSTVLIWCACGAPWDLAATPNFAKLVDDAGFSWPPPSPIRFPLKTW